MAVCSAIFYYEDTTRLDRRLLNVNLPSGRNFITSNLFQLNQTWGKADSIKPFWEGFFRFAI